MKHFFSVFAVLCLSSAFAFANEGYKVQFLDTTIIFESNRDYFDQELSLGTTYILEADSNYVDMQTLMTENDIEAHYEYGYYLYRIHRLAYPKTKFKPSKIKNLYQSSFRLSQREFQSIKDMLTEKVKDNGLSISNYCCQFYTTQENDAKFVFVIGTRTEDFGFNAAIHAPFIIFDGNEIQFKAAIDLNNHKLLFFQFNGPA